MSLILLYTFLSFLCSISAKQNAYKTFSVKESSVLRTKQLNHIIVNNRTGDVYVAGINNLYELNSDLVVMTNVKTGPVNDSPHCIPGTGVCQGLKPTDNYNKILHLHPNGKSLILCGTVAQGSCELRSLSNISDATKYQSRDNMFITSNKPNESTVSFIAPGPSSDKDSSNAGYVSCQQRNTQPRLVMYVGATSSSTMVIRPVISSRDLDTRIFEPHIAGPGGSRGTELYLTQHISVDFIAGFSSGDYSYFISHHPVEGSKNKITKITQLCHCDKSYNSFIEIPLVCRQNGKDFAIARAATVITVAKDLANVLNIKIGDEALLAAFSDSHDSDSTAVCVYSMNATRTKLMENVKKCRKGDPNFRLGMSSNIYHKDMTQMSACPFPTNTLKKIDHPPFYYLCNTGVDPNYSRVIGPLALSASAMFYYPSIRVTALTSVVTRSHTIAFIGTSTGHLKKVILGVDSTPRQYSEIVLEEGSPVSPDMKFDLSRQHIYVMTTTKVTKLPVSECKSRTNCSSCLQPQDPFCGWCLLQNKCTPRSECKAKPRNQHWLYGNQDRCIIIHNVSPQSLSVHRPKELYLTLDLATWPSKTSSYSCVFVEFGWSSPLIEHDMTMSCQTPELSKLGMTIGNQDHKVITLALNSSQTGVLFLKKNLSFYNCSTYTTCKRCTESPWSCDWCIYDNKCVDTEVYQLCQPGVIPGRNSNSDVEFDGKKGPKSCPHLLDQSTHPIYVPTNENTKIIVRGNKYPSPILSGGYKCTLRIESTVVTTEASWINDSTVECSAHQFTYESSRGILEVPLTVSWGNNFRVEDYYDLKVQMYKCHVIGGGECGLCLSAAASNPNHKCRWCEDDCKYIGHCKEKTSLQCPAPLITEVSPLSGPIDGGTNVTIVGKNLGSRVEDVEHNIQVAGYPCVVIPDLYHVSRRVVCKTSRSNSRQSVGKIVVTHNAHDVLFTKDFAYRNPEVTSIEPKQGPKSGGSRITIFGDQLHTGLNIQVLIGDVPCVIDRSTLNDESVQCITSAVDQPMTTYTVTMTFDGAPRELYTEFTFTRDPNITSIHPLKTINSGGTSITVTGSYFLSIQRPLIYATKSHAIATYKAQCTVLNDSEMSCSSPRLITPVTPYIVRHKRSPPTNQQSALHIGFEMDAVQQVRNLTQYFSTVESTLEYYPDPILYNFTENYGVKLYKGEALIIKGDNLNTAADRHTYHVYVGTKRCPVSSLSQTNIVCTPPLTQPEGITDDGYFSPKIPPFVKVNIGNLHFTIGKLKYDKVKEGEAFPIDIIAGVAAAGVFLFVVSVVICVVCRRQNTKSERIYRKMQIQLDTLESNVRNECKQAFAELQTDMTDLTSDLFSGGIPFWDYQTYAHKILFPRGHEHSLLTPPLRNGQIKHTESGLRMFHKLLSNRDFMLSFIHVLEAQKSFTVQDKSQVASLIMVIYQNDMQYATEILKLLLTELVEKSVETKHPKLMLRRTESVVEKLLTNWLSMCLYGYARDHAGSALFILYKAMKLQMEKGPIDFFTGEARYSLSEDKLLREKMEPKSLTLHVMYGDEMYVCRLLDCDTITQAKSKILDAVKKNVPFSERPLIRDLDLEWRDNRDIVHILSDEDCTTKVCDSWRQINTIGHYYLQDSSCLRLVHRDSDESFNGTLDSSTSSSCAMVPLMTSKSIDVEKSTKTWHLVKQNEDGTQTRDGTKMISEIFLTRLLATKGTLQKYIDDLLHVILAADSTLPPAVKYLYDFLDQAADDNGITDAEVVHTWKSNSLLLRFWVNIIKNPNFLFDIDKPPIVDSCLSVVAQTFMDSCSTADHSLSKDSPSNKLLFAKDIPTYKKLVEKYFGDIQQKSAISDQDLNTHLIHVSNIPPIRDPEKYFGDIQRKDDISDEDLNHVSIMSTDKFDKFSALRELYSYVVAYNKELMINLEEDALTSKSQLINRLAQVQMTMDNNHLLV